MNISVQLPAGPEGAGQARRVLGELRRETPSDTLSTLELLVSEIVSSSPRHNDQRAADWVLLEIQSSPQSIRTEITDLGVGPSPAPTPEEEGSAWDVVLLAELSSRWGILEGSMDGLWFEIDRWTRSSLGHPA